MSSKSILPLRSCVTFSKCLTVSGPLFPYRKHGRSLPPRVVERIKPLEMWDGLRTGQTAGTQYVLTITSISVIIASQFHPEGVKGDPTFSTAPFPRAPWAAPLHCKLPRLVPAHSTVPGSWHRTRREQEASPRQRQQMGTSWAGGWGGLAAAWSRQA